ncbi:MAG: VOC family protein [Patescibacteria group bacterium]
MQPRISIITLGVKDLKASTKFYLALGFPLQPPENDMISFFELSGTQLALYPKDLLAKDAKVLETGSGFSGFTLAHNVHSKEEVDTIMKEAERIGAKITDPAHEREWGGYSGYFADLDGYLWEIAWNPYFKFE